MRILKFGGSSLADTERIIAVKEIIRKYAAAYPELIIVISA
jgi:aspartokinase